MSDRPNILVIVSDEHAPHEMGCDGHRQVQTPALDTLADEGLTFDNAYCNSPICTPSRNAYCHEIGAWDLECPLPADAPTWGHHLGKAGYETVLCGRTHWHGPDRLHGFERRLLDDLPQWRRDTYRPPSRSADWRRHSRSHVTECGPGSHPWHHYDRLAARLAEQFIRQKAHRGGDRPWLLHTGLILPHFPLIAPPELLALYDPDDVALPATFNEPLDRQHPAIQQLRRGWRNDEPLPDATQRLATACYDALVTQVDRLVGAMVEALRETGQLDDTVVIYTSDHGEMLGDHGTYQKWLPYDSSPKIPMIAHWPGRITAGERADRFVDLNDLLPTLLDAAGVPLPEEYDYPGESLLTEDGGKDRNHQFIEYSAGNRRWVSLRNERCKYNYFYAEGSEELSDLQNDPEETRNLLHNDRANHERIRADLRERLIGYEQRWGLPGGIEDGDFVNRAPFEPRPYRNRAFPLFHEKLTDPQEKATMNDFLDEVVQAVRDEPVVQLEDLDLATWRRNGGFTDDQIRALTERLKRERAAIGRGGSGAPEETSGGE